MHDLNLRCWVRFSLAVLILWGITTQLQATSLELIQGEEDEGPQKGLAVIPYAFYNDATEAAVAAAVIANGYGQPQMTTVLNGFYSTNDSHNLFLMVKDSQLPGFDRLFFDAVAIRGKLGEINTYTNGNSDFPNEDAGSNNSSEDNYVQSKGYDDHYRLEMRYLLNIGHGQGNPIHQYLIEPNGLLVDGYQQGADSWNPWISGRTYLQFQLFDRQQDLELSNGSETELKTTAAIFSLEYDNTDYHTNPSEGSRQTIAFQRDWGRHDKDGAPWSTIEIDYSKFFSLGQTDKALQRVLAFNARWIDTPTWDSFSVQDGNKVFHRPPAYAGATLGGLYHQKAYPSARFNDRAAINYALEYRYMPTWNPWWDMPVINSLKIRWWQWVAMAEVGRVHNKWDVSELHHNMKWSIGGGVRFYVDGLVVRADIVTSEEQTNIQMFIGHTY